MSDEPDLSWMIDEPKYRLEEVAEILGVDRKSGKKLTDKGRIGFYEIGPRTRRIDLEHLRKYLSTIQTAVDQEAQERKVTSRNVIRKPRGRK